VKRLAGESASLEGPIICIQAQNDSKVVAWDGTHRLGAWFLRHADGRGYFNLPGYLIRTRAQIMLF
jgi:hypothetical protein